MERTSTKVVSRGRVDDLLAVPGAKQTVAFVNINSIGPGLESLQLGGRAFPSSSAPPAGPSTNGEEEAGRRRRGDSGDASDAVSPTGIIPALTCLDCRFSFAEVVAKSSEIQ